MTRMTDTVRAVLNRIDETADDRKRAQLAGWIEEWARQQVLAYSPERPSGTACDVHRPREVIDQQTCRPVQPHSAPATSSPPGR
jgi:hypothetical protein